MIKLKMQTSSGLVVTKFMWPKKPPHFQSFSSYSSNIVLNTLISIKLSLTRSLSYSNIEKIIFGIKDTMWMSWVTILEKWDHLEVVRGGDKFLSWGMCGILASLEYNMLTVGLKKSLISRLVSFIKVLYQVRQKPKYRADTLIHSI